MPHVYAIGDLHLSLSVPNKAMDVFGAHWQNHADRLKEAWQDTVSPEDLVLVPGDISWAMYLADAVADLVFLGWLNGVKLLMRGNHDYWWQSVTKVRAALPDGMYAVQNDALLLNGVAFCGSRGWTNPQGGDTGEDARLYARELIRYGCALEGAIPTSIIPLLR